MLLHSYPYCAVVTVLALLVYEWMGFKVGAARGKYKVQAPATDGPPEFQRAFRAHMNTLEQMVIFFPALWIFASAWGDLLAAIIGVVWPVGRVIFALGYYKAAEKRGPGFGISFLSAAILLLGAIAGIVRRLAFE